MIISEHLFPAIFLLLGDIHGILFLISQAITIIAHISLHYSLDILLALRMSVGAFTH
uniref:Uncharacterized protein n=1 Tax=Rhizophora mucronata TaxID=61149 RepID=A0A2P2QF99_RHIMU